jgi:cation transport ATPase
MLIAIEVLLGLMIVGGLVALEVKKLRTSVMALAAIGLFFVVACFLFGSIEVGIGGIVAFAVLVPLLLWALKRTMGEDMAIRVRPGTNDIFVLVSVAAFMIVFLLVAFLAFPEFVSPPPPPVEGSAGLSILREVLVVVAALAGVWVVIRKAGRRDK